MARLSEIRYSAKGSARKM